MVAEVVRGKALARIVEGATVTDQSGNAVDLKNLRPDGSLGDPDAQPETPADIVESASEPVDTDEKSDTRS
jgi:trigger factor